MSLIRRIINNPSVSSKAIPMAKKNRFVPFPLGRDRSSPPKLEQLSRGYSMDRRPISLRYKVTTMLEMSNLDESVNLSRFAVSDDFLSDGRDNRDTVFICNSVIGAMCEAKRYDEAISLFNCFFNEAQILPNTLSCNLVIKAHCEGGRIEDALDLYRHLILLDDERLAPGIETYRILTKALVDAKRFDEAYDLVRSVPRCDFILYDILIRGFLDIGKFVKASWIFDELKLKLPFHNYYAMTKASFMNYWFKQGKEEEAMEIYANLIEEAEMLSNPIIGNRVLEVLVEHGKRTEAWELFREMIQTGDSVTIEIMLKEFSDKKIASLSLVRRSCYRTMIARLCENGNVLDAEKLFEKMLTEVEGDEDEALVVGPDVVTWRAMINGYVKVGRIEDAMKTLNKMRIWNIRKLAIHRAP